MGAEHSLALSATGDVYAWGSNSEGQVRPGTPSVPLEAQWLLWDVVQLGLGHTNHVREPTVVTMLQGKHIHQVCAGRCHSAAWTAPSLPPRAPGQTRARATPALRFEPGLQLGLQQSVISLIHYSID